MAKTIIFVCSGLCDNTLISKPIEASSVEDASDQFEKLHKIKPAAILGPFYRKRSLNLNKNFEINFMKGENQKGTYSGWYATAIPLLTPANSLYLLFDNRVDGKKMPKPKSIIIRKEDLGPL